MPAAASIDYVNPQTTAAYVSPAAVLSFVAAEAGSVFLVWNSDYGYSESSVINESVLNEFSLG